MDFASLNKEQIKEVLAKELSRYSEFKAAGLKLDMSRGKPCKEQLDLSMGMLDTVKTAADCVRSVDYRNYGLLDGIPEMKDIFSELTGVPSEQIIVTNNASLNIMYDTVQRGLQFGVAGAEPQNKQGKIKWLCPAPGYDRHFAITELFGIEMITVKMTPEGPDMDEVERLVKSDAAVKGIWCVPKYSNPEGVVYSDETVRRMANLKPAAPDFRIYWDNAYMVHYITEDVPLLNIIDECEKAGNPDMVYMFGSTSKITFAGAGVAFVASSKNNIEWMKKLMGIQTIGPDKITQLQHALFFGNADGIKAQMDKHAVILRPKFEKVLSVLGEELGDTGIAKWLEPKGGYFVSCDLMEGTAKKTVAMCKDAGVVFTGAGATYPYKNDPKDSNLRIAPSLPPIEELEKAMRVFCCAAKIAACEKLLAE